MLTLLISSRLTYKSCSTGGSWTLSFLAECEPTLKDCDLELENVTKNNKGGESFQPYSKSLSFEAKSLVGFLLTPKTRNPQKFSTHINHPFLSIPEGCISARTKVSSQPWPQTRSQSSQPSKWIICVHIHIVMEKCLK